MNSSYTIRPNAFKEIEVKAPNNILEFPDKIKIFHRDFDLREFNTAEHIDGHNGYGKIDYPTKTISFAKIDNYETADTLIHEILHALWHYSALNNMNDELPLVEEPVVRVLSSGLITVLRDNPGLLKVLTRLINSNS